MGIGLGEVEGLGEGAEEGDTGEEDVGSEKEGVGLNSCCLGGGRGKAFFVWGSVSGVSARWDGGEEGALGKMRRDAYGKWVAFASARF